MNVCFYNPNYYIENAFVLARVFLFAIYFAPAKEENYVCFTNQKSFTEIDTVLWKLKPIGKVN